MRMGTQCSWGAVLVAIVTLSGCATPVPESPEVACRARAQAWLDALMAFDTEGIYGFTTPAYQSAHTVRHYSRNYAGRDMWKTAALGEISCDGAEELGVCEVELVISYRGFLMKETMTTVLKETWVQIDGAWYAQPRQ